MHSAHPGRPQGYAPTENFSSLPLHNRVRCTGASNLLYPTVGSPVRCTQPPGATARVRPYRKFFFPTTAQPSALHRCKQLAVPHSRVTCAMHSAHPGRPQGYAPTEHCIFPTTAQPSALHRCKQLAVPHSRVTCAMHSAPRGDRKGTPLRKILSSLPPHNRVRCTGASNLLAPQSGHLCDALSPPGRPQGYAPTENFIFPTTAQPSALHRCKQLALPHSRVTCAMHSAPRGDRKGTPLQNIVSPIPLHNRVRCTGASNLLCPTVGSPVRCTQPPGATARVRPYRKFYLPYHRTTECVAQVQATCCTPQSGHLCDALSPPGRPQGYAPTENSIFPTTAQPSALHRCKQLAVPHSRVTCAMHSAPRGDHKGTPLQKILSSLPLHNRVRCTGASNLLCPTVGSPVRCTQHILGDHKGTPLRKIFLPYHHPLWRASASPSTRSTELSHVDRSRRWAQRRHWRRAERAAADRPCGPGWVNWRWSSRARPHRALGWPNPQTCVARNVAI